MKMKKYKIYCKGFDPMIASNYDNKYSKEEVNQHRKLANENYTIVVTTDIESIVPYSVIFRQLDDDETEIENWDSCKKN